MSEHRPKTGSSPTILFVDDEAVSHKVIRKHLSAHKVESAFSAAEALEIIDTGQIQIVITDIKMPGMDGIELLKKIKRIRPIIQIIMVTSSEDMEDLVSAFEAGASDFLLKPVKKEAIEEAIGATVLKMNRWRQVMKALFQKKRDSGPLQEKE